MTDNEQEGRYSRQLLLDDWNREAQARLQGSTVLVAGLGGLGGPVCLYLAAAGVGTLVLCDPGLVELSNLNRQILYGQEDLGLPKAAQAARRIRFLNPGVETVQFAEALTASNIAAAAEGAALLVDCLDNFGGRMVLNAHALVQGLPLVHGGVRGWNGQAGFLAPPATPCLRCLFEGTEGRGAGPLPVLGAAAAEVASLQALMALRYLALGVRPQPGRLWLFDGGTLESGWVDARKDPRCPACSR